MYNLRHSGEICNYVETNFWRQIYEVIFPPKIRKNEKHTIFWNNEMCYGVRFGTN